jgi:hypothetical protein
MENLPNDILVIILSWIDFKSFSSIVLVNKTLKELIDSNETIFKNQCYRIWPVSVPSELVENWKKSFKKIMLQDFKFIESDEIKLEWPVIERYAFTKIEKDFLRADFIYYFGCKYNKSSALLGNYAK